MNQSDECRLTESIRDGSEWCTVCWRYKGFERCRFFRASGYRLQETINGKIKRIGKRTYHKRK